MITRVGMVILLQHQFDEAIKFYQKIGLQLKFHLKNQWAEFRLGDTKIGLCPSSVQVNEHRTGIVFEVDDIYAFYNQFKDSIPFTGEPIEKIHGIMVGIKDPSGNIIDLYQPTPERVKDLIKSTKTTPSDASPGCNQNKNKCCGNACS